MQNKITNVDAVYIPGGAENAVALRSDAGTIAFLKNAVGKADIWTSGAGAQVIASTDALPKGTVLTGSTDLRTFDLPRAGFIVPKDPVALDFDRRLLSAQGPESLSPFVSQVGKRLDTIRWMGWIKFSML